MNDGIFRNNKLKNDAFESYKLHASELHRRSVLVQKKCSTSLLFIQTISFSCRILKNNYRNALKDIYKIRYIGVILLISQVNNEKLLASLNS